MLPVIILQNYGQPQSIFAKILSNFYNYYFAEHLQFTGFNQATNGHVAFFACTKLLNFVNFSISLKSSFQCYIIENVLISHIVLFLCFNIFLSWVFCVIYLLAIPSKQGLFTVYTINDITSSPGIFFFLLLLDLKRC